MQCNRQNVVKWIWSVVVRLSDVLQDRSLLEVTILNPRRKALKRSVETRNGTPRNWSHAATDTVI
eukprot:2106732-Amphidinium_carterae.1